MMMNKRVILYTPFGDFNKAGKALKYLKSYCNRMEREDYDRLLIFFRLYSCEALHLQGKIRDAEEEFSLKKLFSTSFTDLVVMFGGLYISERVEAFEKFSHPPMRSSDSFPAKHTQLRPFKEARRKTISSFYNGEIRRRPKHSVDIKGNGCCNLHRPSDLEKGAVFSTFSDHVSPNGSINGSFRKDQSTSDATLILKATDEFDESCKLESDNLKGPDERVKPSLHCSSRAIKDGRKRKQRMVSCDETSFTSIYQGGYVVDTQEESTLSNETTEEAERQLMATPVEESPRPVCGHYQRRCLTLFPCCGKFFPCHRCHNESDCTEDRATAVNATHIRCTICYNEQVVRLYLRTEFKISSLDEIYSNIAKFPQMQSNRHVKRNIIN